MTLVKRRCSVDMFTAILHSTFQTTTPLVDAAVNETS